MNDRNRLIIRTGLRILKSDRAKELLFDRTWITILGYRVDLSCRPSVWG